MTFPKVGVAEWRAQVDKELAGASFDKTLVHMTPEGLAIQPLYVEAAADSGVPGAAPFTRGNSPAPPPFAICMRHDAAHPDALTADLDGGADALWLQLGPSFGLDPLFARPDWWQRQLVIDGNGAPLAALDALLAGADTRASRRARSTSCSPPIRWPTSRAAFRRARSSTGSTSSSSARAMFANAARRRKARSSRRCRITQAGADAADELAIALSTGVAYLRALGEGGFDVASAARQLAVQISVGRDTFGELCKLRALRLVWHKLFAAAGAPAAPLARLHAVSSPRTLSERDPWVNMLRVTTRCSRPSSAAPTS